VNFFIKLLIVLLTFNTILSADTIYTYGYFDFIYNNLLSLSGIIASGNDYLMKIAVTISLLILIFKKSADPNANFAIEFAKFGAFILIIQQLFLEAPNDSKHKFQIVDRYTLETNEIEQIPLGTGQLLSKFTTLEDNVMRVMDLYFSTPHSTSFRNSGMGFNMNVQTNFMTERITDPLLRATLNKYLDDCIVSLDIIQGEKSYSELFASYQLGNYLKSDQTVLTLAYTDSNPSGEVMTCRDDWNYIDNRINVEANNKVTKIAKIMGLPLSNFANADSVHSFYFGSAMSAKQQLYEAVLRNSTKEGLKKISAQAGVDMSWDISVAEQAGKVQAITSLYEAQKLIPMLKAFFLSVIIAISWILAILTIITFNFVYLKMFLTLMIWLLLWGPLYTILNYFTEIQVKDAVQYYDGINISNQAEVWREYTSELSLLAKLVWAVPMLAYMIAKGSEHAMVSLISSASQTSDQLGRAAMQEDSKQVSSQKLGIYDGNEVIAHEKGAITNENTADTKYGAADKQNISTKDGGRTSMLKSKDGSGQVSLNQSGSGGLTANASGIGLSANAVSNATSQLTKANTNLNLAATNISEQYGKQTQSVINAAEQVRQGTATSEQTGVSEKDANTIGKGVSAATSKGVSAADSKSHNENFKIDEGFRKTHSFATTEGGGAGVDIGKLTKGLIKLNAGADISWKQNDDNSISFVDGKGNTIGTSYDEKWNKNFQETYNQELSHQIATNKDFGNAITTGIDKTNGKSELDADSTTKTLQNAYTLQEQAQLTYQHASALTSSLSKDDLNRIITNWVNKDEMFDIYKNDDGAFKNREDQEAATLRAYESLKSMAVGEDGASDFKRLVSEYGGKNYDSLVNNKEELKDKYNKNSQINKSDFENNEKVNQINKDINKDLKVNLNNENERVKAQEKMNGINSTISEKSNFEKIDGYKVEEKLGKTNGIENEVDNKINNKDALINNHIKNLEDDKMFVDTKNDAKQTYNKDKELYVENALHLNQDSDTSTLIKDQNGNLKMSNLMEGDESNLIDKNGDLIKSPLLLDH
jgi:conjugal transfer mating pair stabilization protein TraG